MAISDAQFAAWLGGPTNRVILYEQDFAWESSGAPAIGTLYFSDGTYRTRHDDTPPGLRYVAALASAPKLKRAIDRDRLTGAATIAASDAVLANPRGALDYILGLVLDGYEGRFYLGSRDWARSDFRLIFATVAERAIASGDAQIAIKHKDKRLLLDQDVIGTLVGGTGPEATAFLPLLFGSHFNVEAKAYDTATGRYSLLSNYAGSSVMDVRDKGGSLTGAPVSYSVAFISALTADAGTDTLTLTAHGLTTNDVVMFQQSPGAGVWNAFAPFAGLNSGQQYWVINPAANTFQLSATRGGSAVDITNATYLGSTGVSWSARITRKRFFDDLTNSGRIQLSSTALGRITADVRADATYVTTPFAFAQSLVTTYGRLALSEIDTAAFTAADAALAAKVALGYTNYSIMQRANLVAVLNTLLPSVFGWYGQTRLGKIGAGVMDVSGIASATASRTIAKSDFADGFLTVENAAPTIGVANVLFELNHTIQTDGLLDSPGVTEDNRRKYATQYQQAQRSTLPSGTAYATNRPLYHKTLVEGDPAPAAEMSSFLYGSSVALPLSNVADELVADAAPHRQYLSASLRLRHYDLELGQVVSLVYPRYGLEGGANACIYAIEIDLTGAKVAVEMVRQRTPDVSKGSYL